MLYLTSELMTNARSECLLMLSIQTHQFSFKLTSIPHTNPKLLAVGAHQANALADIPSNKHVRIRTQTHKGIQTGAFPVERGW